MLFPFLFMYPQRKIDFKFFEPTCAVCTVGSYASLSVCSLSGLHQKSWKIIHISESIKVRSLKLHHNLEGP